MQRLIDEKRVKLKAAWGDNALYEIPDELRFGPGTNVSGIEVP